MNKSQKQQLYKIILTAVIFAVSIFLSEKFQYIYLLPYLVISFHVLKKAGRNILKGQVFDENFLMAIASLGAIAIGEYSEAVGVMLFYAVGELFEDIAVHRSRGSIKGLMEIRPDTANIERDGQVIEVDPDEVSVGDILVVKPGEKVPVDGTVISGTTNLDTMALTGESVPRFVSEGDGVISGFVAIDGLIKIRAEKEYDDSTVSKILELVEDSSLNKSKSEDFITKFARWYTPIVVCSAAIIAIMPLFLQGESFADWIKRALMFLVVSCPCALVVSIPLTYFGGIGGASKRGILIKGANYLEALSQAKIAVFDKTGTLTKGQFEIIKTVPEGCAEDELVELAAIAESFSNHPISLAIRKGRENGQSSQIISQKEIAGKGIIAETAKGTIAAGNKKLMEDLGINSVPGEKAATAVYVAVDGSYKGAIFLADAIKPNAKKAISDLKSAGIEETVMLTGDSDDVAQFVAEQTGIDTVRSRLLPQDKVSCLEEILKKRPEDKKVIYTGDGINDAPVIMRADIGVAMGALGSDAALEAADIVLMNDDISGLATAISLSRKTRRIVTENIVMALGVKFGVLILSALGLISSMWYAVFADVGVLILAVLNAIRMLKS